LIQDDEVCERLRSGDTSAIQELLARDHSVATFVARIMVSDGTADDALSDAWLALVQAVCAGRVSDRLRFELIRRIRARPIAAPPPEVSSGVPTQLGTFNVRGHPWEGWWDEEPPTWPDGAVPTSTQVLAALHRLAAVHREALVLHDLAGLTPAEVGQLVCGVAEPERLLDGAREGYLCAIDYEMSCTP